MAKTETPLVWSVCREVNNAAGLGSVVHYYDETSQSLWLNDGLMTAVADIPKGHWNEAIQDQQLGIGTPAYKSIEIDHAYNGAWFGVATVGNELVYLRYIYAIDCSDISSGSISMSNNNAVSQIKANVMSIKDTIFMDDATVFQPGARVILKLLVAGEDPCDLGMLYLDSVDYGVKSENVPMSGRNSIGFKLMASTFDEVSKLSGKSNEVIAQILELAGIKKHAIEASDVSREYEFKPDETLLSGMEKVLEFNPGWTALELPSGMVVVGGRNFISDYQQNGYYVFDIGTVFKRKTKRSSDGAYTKVMVVGTDADGKDLVPVVVPVSNYSMWRLPANKTYHETAPAGLTQSELQDYAESLASELQYVGVGEDFTSSIQPQLTIGDVVAVDNGDGTMTTLGVVTSIKHSFGKSGFTTEFSTDSGGIMMESYAAEGNVITSTKPLNGYTRKQTLKDVIQVASGSSAAGPQASGVTVKIVTNPNAQTLDGKTYDQVIDAAATEAIGKVKQVPDYTPSDYGKFLTPTSTGLHWLEAGGGGGGGTSGPLKVQKTYVRIQGSYFNTQSDVSSLLTIDGHAEGILMYDLGLIGPHYISFAARGIDKALNRQRICFSNVDLRTLVTGTTFECTRLAADGSTSLNQYTFDAIVNERYAYVYLNDETTAQEYNAVLVHT